MLAARGRLQGKGERTVTARLIALSLFTAALLFLAVVAWLVLYAPMLGLIAIPALVISVVLACGGAAQWRRSRSGRDN
jgi:preprotein translocase subunit SecD